MIAAVGVVASAMWAAGRNPRRGCRRHRHYGRQGEGIQHPSPQEEAEHGAGRRPCNRWSRVRRWRAANAWAPALHTAAPAAMARGGWWVRKMWPSWPVPPAGPLQVKGGPRMGWADWRASGKACRARTWAGNRRVPCKAATGGGRRRGRRWRRSKLSARGGRCCGARWRVGEAFSIGRTVICVGAEGSMRQAHVAGGCVLAYQISRMTAAMSARWVAVRRQRASAAAAVGNTPAQAWVWGIPIRLHQ